MKRKLITVCWSYTVEMDVPEHLENISVDELEDFTSPKEIQDLASNAVRQAGANLNWKDGIITDIQDV